MSEIETAANPTTEEAIKYLERMLFTQDFSPSTLRAKAVNTMAIEALREQAERSGCEVCNSLVAMRYETVCDWSDDGKAVWDTNTMHFCPNCGAKMESEGGT